MSAAPLSITGRRAGDLILGTSRWSPRQPSVMAQRERVQTCGSRSGYLNEFLQFQCLVVRRPQRTEIRRCSFALRAC